MQEPNININQLTDVKNKQLEITKEFYSSSTLTNDGNEITYTTSNTGGVEYNPESLIDRFRESCFQVVVSSKIPIMVTHLPKKKLLNINDDIEVSQELCILFLSYLNKGYKKIIEGKEPWVTLNAKLLQQNLGCTAYKKIISLLIEGTRKGYIIDRSSYAVGKTSFSYQLSENYYKTSTVAYTFKTKRVRELILNRFNKDVNSILNNPICNNLFNFYSTISLPTITECTIEGKRLVKAKTIKKGKQLTMLNKHSKDYWSNSTDRRFIENDIKLYGVYTKADLRIPTIKVRIYDSINLIPYWIRNMITINGCKSVSLDYSCLHPNLLGLIYGGSGTTITHEDVADYLHIGREEAKKMHLSFFNRTIEDGKGDKDYMKGMKSIKLYDYYLDKEPDMLRRIIEDKRKFGYKVTSEKLMKLEVELMSNVVIELNNLSIYVGYVFDCLICSLDDKDIVLNMMNSIAVEMNINTTASIE